MGTQLQKQNAWALSYSFRIAAARRAYIHPAALCAKSKSVTAKHGVWDIQALTKIARVHKRDVLGVLILHQADLLRRPTALYGNLECLLPTKKVKSKLHAQCMHNGLTKSKGKLRRSNVCWKRARPLALKHTTAGSSRVSAS